MQNLMQKFMGKIIVQDYQHKKKKRDWTFFINYRPISFKSGNGLIRQKKCNFDRDKNISLE